MVRLAETKDIPAIVGLLRQQIPESNLKRSMIGFSPSKSANLVKSSINQGFAWVYENEGISGLLLAESRLNMFSDIVSEAYMTAIFVKPEHRKGIAAGRLLKSFLSRCEETKTQLTWIGSTITSSLDEKTMNKLGFKLQEQLYLKES